MRGAELVRDLDQPRAWTLLIDGFPQSHVDLDDPAHLEFEYIRRLGHLIDALPPGPLRMLHLGAGALTLARWVAASRPGSDQLAVDLDAGLVALIRERLPLPVTRRGRIRVRIADARAALDGMRPGTFDVVISDVFAGGQTPASLTSAEFAASAARALRAGGVFAANVADGAPLRHVRAQVATVRAVFPYVCLIAEPGVLRGRRFGNTVLAGRDEPLPVARLVRDMAADPMPARVLDGGELIRFAAGAHPVSDADAAPSPAPPQALFGRGR